MQAKQPTAYVCIVALLAAAALAQPLAGSVRGDVNGDQQVDVRDVQSVIAGMLGAGATGADVNGDGRIDVLDFQFTLFEAGRPDTEDEIPPADSLPDTCHLSQQSVTLALLECRRDPVVADRQASEARPWFERADCAAAPPQTERYLFRLTPHAPPAYA